MSASHQPYSSYPMASPISTSEPLSSGSGSGPRAPPLHSYNESPRMQPFSSSPGLHQLSPVSPATHMGPPSVLFSSTSTSSSSFRSIGQTPLHSSRDVHPTSASSNGSWDGNGSLYMRDSVEADSKEHDAQPWGMKQEEYRALCPKDKKQVRNRIGARRFRAKKKTHMENLQQQLRSRDEEVKTLRAQTEAQQLEINNLRSRLGMALLPPVDHTGLGLLVSSNGAGGGGGGGGPGGSANAWEQDAGIAKVEGDL